MTARTAEIQRQTAETKIALTIDLAGTGKAEIGTGVGFSGSHADAIRQAWLFVLTVKCDGDTHIDAHHSTEDIGICLGQAFAKALGDKRGITRYGHLVLRWKRRW